MATTTVAIKGTVLGQVLCKTVSEWAITATAMTVAKGIAKDVLFRQYQI